MNYEKCTQGTFSMPKAITQIKLDNKTRERPKAGSNLGTSVSVLKYLISLLQHLSKLFCWWVRKYWKKMVSGCHSVDKKTTLRITKTSELRYPPTPSKKLPTHSTPLLSLCTMTVSQNGKYGKL